MRPSEPFDFVRFAGNAVDVAVVIDGSGTMLALSLNITATGEGVESANQLAELCSLGCDFVQGFHFDRPVSLDQLSSLWLSPTSTETR
jgi:EAL domain-containing protein (putative c-di-GMP-specific phosphodiesterase class I)